jgi:YggT family protein
MLASFGFLKGIINTMRTPFDIVISTVGNLLSLLIIVDSVLSFVLPPYHPVREAFGKVLQPMYAPIRRVIPPVGMFDLTPIVLLILIQVLVMLLTSIF